MIDSTSEDRHSSSRTENWRDQSAQKACLICLEDSVPISQEIGSRRSSIITDESLFTIGRSPARWIYLGFDLQIGICNLLLWIFFDFFGSHLGEIGFELDQTLVESALRFDLQIALSKSFHARYSVFVHD
jgi:hypothetical protein